MNAAISSNKFATDSDKEANLLMGDAINNFKTVQSFGHEDLVVKTFENLIRPGYENSVRACMKSAVALGLSNAV